MRRGGQGEALAVWAVWLLTLLAVVVTYARVDAAELYNVRGSGLGLGLSRAAVHTNWPFALVAIVLVLVAMRDLPRRAWWAAGVAIALCATMPAFVSQSHLNARWGNLVPAVGVALALGLAVVACRRAGSSFQPRLRVTRCGSPSPSWCSSCRCPGSRQSSASTCRVTCSWGRSCSPRRMDLSRLRSTSASTMAGTGR